MNANGGASRRDILKAAVIGVAGASSSAWIENLAAHAAESDAAHKSIILLWLQGGPATIDLWDLKPGHANGGSSREIETSAPGLRISEKLPQLAKWGREMVLLRSLASKEGDHARATQFVRTGYLPQGGIDFPVLGALAARELGDEQTDLPNFVSIAPPSRMANFAASGFLGPRCSPLMIGQGAASSADLNVPELHPPEGRRGAVFQAAKASEASMRRAERIARQELLRDIDARFRLRHQSELVDGYQSATQRAMRMMRPEAASAFDLDREDDKSRDVYGRTLFGQGCLLARRLVERGVPFVEVTLEGWDTHQDNFNRVAALAGELDRAFAALLADLDDRGLLDSTLVVCTGEFGRTPKINGNAGRDHWPKAWAAALAGGGILGGQAIGATTADGQQVDGPAHTVPDFIATVCQVVGIDPRRQHLSNVNRPIRIADPSAKPIEGVN
ncbi:MAG: DUF1501 domain-containing protein [Pirellulaceae bacterium]